MNVINVVISSGTSAAHSTYDRRASDQRGRS